MATFKVRRQGNGIDKENEYPTLRKAIMFTSMSMVDNGYTDKRTAQQWAAKVPGPGTYEGFGGMTYTITKEK